MVPYLQGINTKASGRTHDLTASGFTISSSSTSDSSTDSMMMEGVQQSSTNGNDSQTITIPTTISASQISHIAQQMSLGGSPVTVVQLPGGQFQVQGVIQSAQSSVIQAPQVQASQGQSDSDDSQESSDSAASSHKSRELLARRPSYRKILNDLSSEEVASRNEGEEDSAASTAMTTVTVPTPIYQTSTGQYIAIAPNGTIQLTSPGGEGMQGLQTLTMTNSGSAQPGATILQYAQTPDGQQILVPSNQVVVQSAGGEVQTYQIRTAPTTSSIPQTVVMTSPMSISSQSTKTDDPQMKREIRLAKNREAARECRRKKKEYVKCLENRVAVLENQNKTLIEELKTLKDLYCVKTG
ncbi:cyclic AMP-dependent transcription factor ATF-1 [Paramormyrops kingsleyae]|uniref:cyclic AMP-dependent transcription factor ATF-1 n=1 Tax=Paramormyrops kingsleyae TaxID=1676925 RepID=UPI000CD60E06|nr:cyclic AMP-dependent transcription factor ATF-1 isoform X1 [Paramormyrops kingsleyae]